jgi:transcriptional regulator with XRE-family HTH domain
MSTFQTTDIQKVRLYEIAAEMKKCGLSAHFIASAVEFAKIYEGGFDLFELWSSEESTDERDLIIADLQHEVEEWEDQVQSVVKKPYVSFDHLDFIGKDVRGFKDRLKSSIDKWGGVSKLAKETGIPQPSLSRMLGSNSMPRRTTIYKIANALGLSEKEIITEWFV